MEIILSDYAVLHRDLLCLRIHSARAHRRRLRVHRGDSHELGDDRNHELSNLQRGGISIRRHARAHGRCAGFRRHYGIGRRAFAGDFSGPDADSRLFR